jgi:glycoprotease/Kae1 family metallohydrolase
MICLGIEATAHTFAAAVVTGKKEILSDVRDVYTTKTGGMIPKEVAKHHELVKDRVIRESIENSKVKKIDLVAYSRGPGLGRGVLHIGLEKAKEIAKDLNAPLIGVNHCISHLTSGSLFTDCNDPVYVYVSGANTQIIALEGGKYRIFGETLDVGMGNALDKFGRDIGLGFPAGPIIEELAKQGEYIDLPYSVKGMDLSFSGIVTKAVNLFKKGSSKEDLCFSLQENIFAMLCEVTERAMAHCNKKEALLIGGVAANKRLVEMLGIMCKERNAEFYAVPLKYSGDNAAMIAWQGILEYQAGRRKDNLEVKPYERTDEVDVFW